MVGEYGRGAKVEDVKRRVAVIGAGIAGAGAAWALHRAGHEVEVFGAAPEVGGNARTHTWSDARGPITAGLAVLAWPEPYFNNYRALLEALAIASEPVRLRFFLRRGDAVYAHGRGGELAERHAGDLRRWRRLIERVRAINARFDGEGPPSLYRVSYKNPLTYLPARALARAAGISRAFWDDVVVALYSSSFLTARLDGLPAVILPTIDAMISVEEGGHMRTWSGHSGEVFERLLDGVRVHRGLPIVHVRGDEHGASVRDARGGEHRFDDLVLAAGASALAGMLDPSHRVARALLGRVRYVEADDDSFMEGHAHTDAGVLPEAHRAQILGEYCTLIDIVDGPRGRRYENHFVVSSWAPAARGRDAVMLVSYGLERDRVLGGEVRSFSNRGAHPALSIGNLIAARALSRLQGRRHLHYCGSYTTPGNGHDLSLLSGLVVAEALGAGYPFAGDSRAAADFSLLRAMMRS
jgi:predicted NAD/FAD-binding protein